MSLLSVYRIVPFAILTLLGLHGSEAAEPRWPPEKAWQWYQGVGPICGFNYLPRTAVNTTEMWQRETFDPKTIDEELGWAEKFRLNSARVFVQYVVYEADPQGLIERMERLLAIAEKHHVSVMFVLFDDCFIPEPKLGPQPDPVPGVHNSQWTASPGNRRKAKEHWPELEKYVKGVVGHFAGDKRVLAWDLYNEAGKDSRALLEAAFAWARSAQPSQPLTSCWQADDLFDIVTFHDYGAPNSAQLARWMAARPALCTECIARGHGSRFDNVLPAFAERGIGWYAWGLVKGRIQTHYPWGSAKGSPEPKPWHHDLLQPDGTPYSAEEIERIGRFGEQFKPLRQAIALLTSQDKASGALAGWRTFVEDPKVNAGEVWKLDDQGILTCRGTPKGYIATEKDYTNFTLRLQWRWPPGKPGNGGVLLRMTGPDKIWPKSLEAQINAGDAGDFWGLDGFSLSGPAERIKRLAHAQFGQLVNLKKTAAAEKPAGQWNQYEIVARGDTVTLSINGQLVNRATGCAAAAGKICLTAEGSEYQFRQVQLAVDEN